MVAFDDINRYNVITMRTKLVSIGNSKGIRIPKAVIEQCELNDEVEMDIRGGALAAGSMSIPGTRCRQSGLDRQLAAMQR